jgi:hypothetical protein
MHIQVLVDGKTVVDVDAPTGSSVWQMLILYAAEAWEAQARAIRPAPDTTAHPK